MKTVSWQLLLEFVEAICVKLVGKEAGGVGALEPVRPGEGGLLRVKAVQATWRHASSLNIFFINNYDKTLFKIWGKFESHHQKLNFLF